MKAMTKNYIVPMRRRKHQIMLISRRNFMVFAWKDTESATSHLNDFDALWSQLQAQKMSIDDERKNVSSYYAHCLPCGKHFALL